MLYDNEASSIKTPFNIPLMFFTYAILSKRIYTFKLIIKHRAHFFDLMFHSDAATCGAVNLPSDQSSVSTDFEKHFAKTETTLLSEEKL